MTRSGMSQPRWGPLSGPLGSHESLPVLWLDGVNNQVHRLSHRVEADESSNLVCCSLDRVVERKARVKPAVSPPFQRNTVNLNHCARFVFLSRAID